MRRRTKYRRRSKNRGRSRRKLHKKSRRRSMRMQSMVFNAGDTDLETWQYIETLLRCGIGQRQEEIFNVKTLREISENCLRNLKDDSQGVISGDKEPLFIVAHGTLNTYSSPLATDLVTFQPAGCKIHASNEMIKYLAELTYLGDPAVRMERPCIQPAFNYAEVVGEYIHHIHQITDYAGRTQSYFPYVDAPGEIDCRLRLNLKRQGEMYNDMLISLSNSQNRSNAPTLGFAFRGQFESVRCSQTLPLSYIVPQIVSKIDRRFPGENITVDNVVVFLLSCKSSSDMNLIELTRQQSTT